MRHPWDVRLVALALWIALALLPGCASRVSESRAQAGLLDLGAWDLEKNGPAALSGEWDFYWMRFIPPAELAGGRAPDAETVSVPGVWPDHDAKGPRTTGFATYHLRLRLGRRYGSLAIKQLPIDTAYTMYVNGHRVASSGRAGESAETSRPQWMPQIIPLDPSADSYDIVLHVSNFDLNEGGPFYDSYIGTSSQIQSMRDLGVLRDGMLMATLFLFGVYHLLLFAFRRSQHSALYFGIACLFAAARAAAGGEKLFFQALPDVPWEVLQKFSMLGGYGILPFWMGFLYNVFPREMSKGLVRAIQALCALTALIVVVFPARIHFQTGLPYYALNTASFIYAAVMLGVGVYRKREGSALVLSGVLIILASLIHDFLFELGYVHGYPLYSGGVFLFFFIQSIALARLLSRAFERVELLSGELEKKNADLLELDTLKDEFLANTSHELRTPLNGIIGIAESLIEGAAGNLGTAAEKNLRLVVSSGRRLASLVSDLLDFSRMQHGDVVLRRSAVDVSAVIEVVVEITRPLAAKEVTLIHERSILPPVFADEDRVEQILHNLTGNALKFTERGSVRVFSRAAGDMVEICVEDTGIGIPESRQEMIFESFTQADGSVARKYGGTGLGLSISKKLVEMMGGRITVESTPGRGSRFSFTLPVWSAKQAEADLPVQASSSRGDFELPPMQALVSADDAMRPDDPALEPFVSAHPPAAGSENAPFHALIVDDDPINLRVLRNHLELRGYIVNEASDGAQALKILESRPPCDVVLLDVMMPGLSGYEVCREIRRRYSPSELPIILLTAKSRITDVVTGLESGANDYLAKPFEPRELIARVRTMVELKAAAGSQSALAALHNELKLATEMQRSLLPSKLPEVAGLQIAVQYRSMQSVGGDFYDFSPSETRLGVLIADVSGHGVPAAMLTSVVKTAFSMQKAHHTDPAQLMKDMNRTLLGNTGNEFVTACYVLLDTENRNLIIANAGHPALLLWRKREARLEILRPRGRLLGVFDSPEFEVADAGLEPGDRIVMYTDGLYEAPNREDENFGETRLRDFVAAHHELGPEAFAQSLVDLVTEWSGGAERVADDIAVVVLDFI